MSVTQKNNKNKGICDRKSKNFYSTPRSIIKHFQKNCARNFGKRSAFARVRDSFGARNQAREHAQRREFADWIKLMRIFSNFFFQLDGYVNKLNCRIWGAENPLVIFKQVMHPPRVTVGVHFGLANCCWKLLMVCGIVKC